MSPNVNAVELGIEVMQVAQHVAERVADLAVAVGDALHQVVGGHHVFAEIHRRDPQANDLRTQLVGDFDRIDGLPSDFVHGAALRIERPAVRRHAAIGRSAFCAHGAEQGRVEPSAMLVAALEVEVGRPGQSGLVSKHCRMA